MDLPHDWSIEGNYSEDNSKNNAFLPGGLCWYKKEIDWNDSWTGKLVFIDFEGAYKYMLRKMAYGYILQIWMGTRLLFLLKQT
ncbi:MAG: hypothetical protein LBJ72_14795 [Dysgonamonadaceae bacterium]|nr:hypothetical protein [Dysgonamonadaceae bacterium]